MKYLLLMISYLFTFVIKGKKEAPSLLPFQIVKNILRQEISLVVYKALVGVVLVSIIIFCMNQMGRSFSIIMSQLEYGYIIEFVVFIAIVGGCSFFLHRIFSSKPLKASSTATPSEEELFLKSLDLGGLKTQLIKGFLEGLETPSKTQPEGSPPTPSAPPTSTQASSTPSSSSFTNPTPTPKGQGL